MLWLPLTNTPTVPDDPKEHGPPRQFDEEAPVKVFWTSPFVPPSIMMYCWLIASIPPQLELQPPSPGFPGKDGEVTTAPVSNFSVIGEPLEPLLVILIATAPAAAVIVPQIW